MRILGIDPGYATTGVGLLEARQGEYRLLQYGVVTTPKGESFPLSCLTYISTGLRLARTS